MRFTLLHSQVLSLKVPSSSYLYYFYFIKILRVGEDKNQRMGSENMERAHVHDSRFFFPGLSTIQEKNIRDPLTVANFC